MHYYNFVITVLQISLCTLLQNCRRFNKVSHRLRLFSPFIREHINTFSACIFSVLYNFNKAIFYK